jgi:hypothetical protein
MKGIETQLANAASLDFNQHTPIDPSQLERVHLLDKMLDVFQLPKTKQKASILDEVFHFQPSLDFCDNEAQVAVLRHHYENEFVNPAVKEEELLKDYREDSVIHKVVDDQPSTYRGKNGAMIAWQDLNSYMKGPCTFDLKHISICQGHAQVNWVAEVNEPNHKLVYGTDSFTFDKTNHISMQSTVAMSDKDES